MVKPTCPDTHIFNKSDCSCKKKTKKKSTPITITKRKRCPNGTYKNKETGECVSKSKIIKHISDTRIKPITKHVSMAQTVQKKTTLKTRTKRCPKGTRRNKKTGLCEKTKPETKKLITVVDNTIDKSDRVISNSIQNMIDLTISKPPSSKELFTRIKENLMKEKSFSPQVNKALVSFNTGIHEDIFGCNLSLNNINTDNFKIRIGTKKVKGVEQPICVKSTSLKAKKILLNNLKRSNMIKCENVIAPIQKLSNCWFNTMFMTLFISDKGRKFFKYFRQLMILGKQANGTTISPPLLRDAFFLLNACIEASMNISQNKQTNNLALNMDTNNVIELIYKSIPNSKKTLYKKIVDKDEANNPLNYYIDIMKFLSNESIRLVKFSASMFVNNIFSNSNNVNPAYLDLRVDKYNKITNAPDIIVIIMHDDVVNLSITQTNSNTKKKPLDITLVTSSQKIKYVLDASIIRDTTQSHFVSLLTCNGKEKTFEGASISRLSNLNWKSMLNKNQEWTYKYNRQGYPHLRWNFCNGYQIHYYYRVN